MSVIRQSGVSLIEVLIALVVFAIGVGGMLGLQLRSIGMSVDATQRSIVLAKSQELADRMRSNAAAMPGYVGTFDNTGGAYCAATPVNCADSNDGAAATCTAAQMAAYDLWDVFCRADTGMQDSIIDWRTTVTCTSAACNAPLDTLTINTQWISRTADTDEDLAATAGTAADRTVESLTLSFIP